MKGSQRKGEIIHSEHGRCSPSQGDSQRSNRLFGGRHNEPRRWEADQSRDYYWMFLTLFRIFLELKFLYNVIEVELFFSCEENTPQSSSRN
jgi:hypothetical protein